MINPTLKEFEERKDCVLWNTVSLYTLILMAKRGAELEGEDITDSLNLMYRENRVSPQWLFELEQYEAALIEYQRENGISSDM